MKHFTSIEYLKIAIANAYGLDRENWDVRIKWVDDNLHQLPALLKSAESPAMYFAACNAYAASVSGQPIGFPISLDATASGMQIYSVLIGDRKTAKLCNVIPNETNSRVDGYTELYKAMQSRLTNNIMVSREDTKQAVMTSFYASIAEPKNVFGTGITLATFYRTMEEEATASWQLNFDLLSLWNPEALSHDWILPDNFHVKCKVMDAFKVPVTFCEDTYDITIKTNRPIEFGRAMGANIVHSVDAFMNREMLRRCYYNPLQIMGVVKTLNSSKRRKKSVKRNRKYRMAETLWNNYLESGFLSARILDYINYNSRDIVDANVIMTLIESLPERPFPVLSVHDCFRCHPNYANDLRQQYINILAEIARSEMLQFIVQQVATEPVTVEKEDPLMWMDVYNAEYPLS